VRGKRFWGAKVLGIIVSVVLPVVVLSLWRQNAPSSWPEVVTYFGTFLLAAAAGQAGLLLWGARTGWMAGQDVLIGAAAGGAAWIAERLALAQGGGIVDPSLLALLAAYGLMVWPHSHRRL
jgi:hypothetical protein